MYVIVQHRITDPDAFWAGVQESTPRMPGNLSIHHCLPKADGTRAVCVWEGESVDAVRDFVESSVGSVSRNEYFDAEAKQGVNLPSAVSVS